MYISMSFLHYDVHVVYVSLDYLFINVYKLSLVAAVCLKMINPVCCFSTHPVWSASIKLTGAPAGLCCAPVF